MKKVVLYSSIILASVSLSSCSLLQSKSTQATANQVATNVGAQVVGDLMTGQKISGSKMLAQNLPQLISLISQASQNGSATDVLKYLSIFKGLGLEQKALQYILPNIFSSGLANNSAVSGQLVNILAKSFGKQQASGLFNQAVQSIDLSNITNVIGGKKSTTKDFAMDFLGQKLPVGKLLKAKVSSPKQAKQQIQKEVLNTVFAKLLTK